MTPLLAVMVAGCAGAQQAPQAVGGVLDLRGWDLGRDGPVTLDGQWLFSWKSFDAPSDGLAPQPAATTLVAVPGPWNDVRTGGAEAGTTGYGSYRLTVDCNPSDGLALALPLQHSAARYYVNGREVARQGSPGESVAQARPAPYQQIVYLDQATCPLQVLVHVSNFDLRRGGLVRSMGLGTRQQIHALREKGLARDLLVLGCLAVMSLLPLLFFLKRRNDRSPLYFGLFCLSFALYTGLSGERVLQPWMAPLGWSPYFKLVFLSLYMNVTLLVLFLRAIYPSRFSSGWVRAITFWGVGSTTLLLLMPLPLFALSVPLLQAGAAVSGLYMIVVLGRTALAGDRSALLLLGGLLALAGAIAHDSLNLAHLRAQGLAPWGMVVFVLAPGILLAQRFARALSSEELRAIEQRERADLLVRSTRAGLLDWNAVTGTVVYSERMREMLGYATDGEALPAFQNLLHAEDRKLVQDLFAAQLRDHAVRDAVRSHQPLEYRLMRKDGEAVWVHAEGIALCGADGRTLRFICSFIDISERKRQEIDLSNRVKFINDLFDSVPIGLALRDAQGRHLLVNRTWENYVGVGREEVVGTSLRDMAGRAAESTLALDQRALQLGPGQVTEPQDYDFRGRRYMQTRTVMVDAEGRRIGVLVASLDITEKYATEQALGTERERLRLLVRSTRAGFGDWDAVRDVVTYSDRFKTMLGHPADADTSGWPSIFEMMHPDDQAQAREEFRAMIRRKSQPGEQEPGRPMSYRLRRTDGSYIWIHAEGIAQVDAQGRTRRFITSYYDVTRFREQEEALKENVRLREEVERISRHDLKTPLNSIIAVPRLLREERALNADEDALLGVVERAGYRILSMVNLSLDLYKMENGSYIFRPDAVDLVDLLDKVLGDLRSHAASKGVSLRVETPVPVPPAWAEELLCYSLLANLVKNALEASPEGAEVRITLQAQDDGQAVLLRIHNHGAVPDAVRDNFFGKYATAGKASGTGLGTYSALLMARVQDGDVTMQTSEATGTTLCVRLRAAPQGQVPAATRHAAERRSAPQPLLTDLPALRVLLVDDDEYNLLIVRRFLPTPPFSVETAINGRMALDMVQRSWPDVIFMDLDMPVMGGLEAVVQLREHERVQGLPRCLIFALSSHDDDATQQRCLASGFDRYLTKPVSRETLHEALLLAMGQGPADAGLPTPALAQGATQGPGDVVWVETGLWPLMDEFLASRRALAGELGQALAAADRPAARALAHKLAGSLALYGFQWAAGVSREIELGCADADLHALEQQADALRNHLAQVRVQAEDESGPTA
ncbi:MAG: PAS domain-containing protein [Ramlibacter sp.]|nr:PAS domain-containing protein [Ramlibacter sp.]